MADETYETDDVLHQYLLFHFGTAEQQFPYSLGGADGLDFPRRCVTEGVDWKSTPAETRALDLGCAVGRSTFELARTCADVVGIDASQAFIDAAQRLQRDGHHAVVRVDEGAGRSEHVVSVEDDIDVARVAFEHGDAQDLRADLGTFDVVLACNLVCRLPEPMKLLSRLPDLVRPGGQLLVTTPFTWLETYTPEANWLGKGGGRAPSQGFARPSILRSGSRRPSTCRSSSVNMPGSFSTA